MSPRHVLTLAVWIVLLLLTALAIVGPNALTADETGAVCSTDADCARWEIEQGIPESERCHGKPCARIPR
jgi:hypothetical protein